MSVQEEIAKRKSAYWENKGKKPPKDWTGIMVCSECMATNPKIAHKGPFHAVPGGYAHTNCPSKKLKGV